MGHAADEGTRTGGATRDTRAPRLIGFGAFVVALVVFCLYIGRPAFWQDEAFSVELTRRDWYQLGRLIYFTDAPLGPYYVLMKPWLSISDAEWWARLPSAVAAAAGIGLLARTVARVLGWPAAAASAAILIALPSVSRFAQEVRPYAIALALGVLASAAWWSLLTRGGWRRGLLYAVTVALVPLAHLLALTVVLAQVLATPFGAPPGGRLRTTVRVALWSAVGAAAVSPFIALAVIRAQGVAHPRASSWAHDWLTVSETFGTARLAGIVLVLAAVGLLAPLIWRRVPADEGGPPVAVVHRNALLIYALLWGFVPMAVLCLAAAFGSKTLIARYFLVALPGWAVLAGSGCVVLGRLLERLFGHLVGSRLVGSRRVGMLVGVAAPLAVVVALGISQQESIRAHDGHQDGDVRPAIALLREPAHDRAAVVVPKVAWMAVVETYGPDLITRMPLRISPVPSAALVVPMTNIPTAVARIRRYGQIAVVVQGDVAAATALAQHIPGATGLRTEQVWSEYGWSVVFLER